MADALNRDAPYSPVPRMSTGNSVAPRDTRTVSPLVSILISDPLRNPDRDHEEFEGAISRTYLAGLLSAAGSLAEHSQIT